MTCIHHHSSLQASFPTPNIPRAPPVHLSLPQALATSGLFTASAVSPFPECQGIGIIQYVAFSDWLPSPLGEYAFKFLHVSESPLNIPW